MVYNSESNALLMTQVSEKLQQVCANNTWGRGLPHPSSKIDDGHSFVTTTLPMPALSDTMEIAKGVLNLQEIDQKIGELDQIMTKAQLGCPGEAEAVQWKELSLLTLQWSRKNLIDQRQACLQRIVDLASEQLLLPFKVPAEPGPVAPQLPAVRPPPGLEDVCSTADATPTASGHWVTNEQPSESLPASSASEEEAEEVPVNSETQPRKESGVPDLENNGDTLRMHLQILQEEEDPKNVLILRKINKLGFESPELLESYFSEYGEVKRVLVAHSRVKQCKGRARSRIRPAGLGFVVMGDRADIDAVLCMGEQQLVCGVPIQVQSYEQRGKQEFMHYFEDES
jgi:hypothetical protein